MKKAFIKEKGELKVITVLEDNEVLKEVIKKIGSVKKEYYKKEERETTRKENRKENENV